MKKSIPFLVLALSFSALAGCSTKEDTTTPSKDSTSTTNITEATETQTESTEKTEKSDSASIEQTDKKLAAYVDCINSHSNRALDSYNRYLSWADEANGPSGSEQNIYGLYTLVGDVKKCADGLKAAKTLKPSLPPLEQAGEAYATALVNLEPLLNEANEYYEEKNYKDDNMTKGKEMHGKLIAAFKAFDTADSTMRTELEKIQDELDAKRLVELEKTEGKKYAWHITNTMMMAKKVWNQSNVTDLKAIKLEELQKAIENLEKAVDELKAYNSAHKDSEPTTFSFFLNESNNLVTASKELMRRVRDNDLDFDTGETALINAGSDWMVEGTPGKVLKSYNSLVSNSNMMQY